MPELATIQNALLAYTANVLSGKQVGIEELESEESLFQECRHQSVALLLFPSIKNKLSSELHGKWAQYSHQLLAANLRSELAHCQLHQIMAAASIPYVIMKGCASAAYYPDPALRTMGDVDFLISPSDLEQAKQALEAAGYTRDFGHDDRVHISYHKGEGASKIILEMHWEPNGVPAGKNGEIVREYLGTCISEAIPYETPSGIFMGPSHFHHGLILLLHTATHLINSGVGLRHLCDWAVFVETFSDEEFCNVFEQKLKAAGLWRFAQILTQLSSAYLGCSKKTWAGNPDSDYLEELMADILAGGNFGKKDSQRLNQAKLMTDKKTGTVTETSMFKQFCRTMNEKAALTLPVIKRFRILLPIGWLYVGLRHLIRVLTGKRAKINLKSTLSGAEQRSILYRQLRLFEIEE